MENGSRYDADKQERKSKDKKKELFLKKSDGALENITIKAHHFKQLSITPWGFFTNST